MTPGTINGINTQAPHIIVDKIDEHYERAVTAGAEIIIEIKDEDYGGRGFTCKDKEGHLWNFGSLKRPFYQNLINDLAAW